MASALMMTPCLFCGAGGREKCTTASGNPVRFTHKARWDRCDRWFRSRYMVHQMVEDDVDFGLRKGDLILTISYPYDQKVTALMNLSGEMSESHNQYMHSVQFVRWADEEDIERFESEADRD